MGRFRPIQIALLAAVIVSSACGARGDTSAQAEAQRPEAAQPAAVDGAPAADAGVASDATAAPGSAIADPAGAAAVTGSPGVSGVANSGASQGSGSGSKSPAGQTSAGQAPAARSGGGAASPGQKSAAGASGVTPPTGPGSVPAPGTPAAPGASRSEITVASVGQQSGLVGGIVGTLPKGAKLWVQDINSRGGLNGHPVRYLIADDGGDPARHQALVKQMVEAEHAVAFLAMNAPVNGSASADYLRSKRIPVIGTEGGATWAYSHWNYFIQGFQAPYLGLAGVGGLAQNNPGKKKLGVIGCVEVTGCQLFYDTAPDDARDHKLDLVYRAKVSLTAPDFTSECIQARNAGVEFMMLGVDSNTVQRFMRSCKNIGFSPPASMPHAAATTVLEDPNLDGLTEAVPFLPFVKVDHPAIAELRQARDKFAPGAKIEIQFTGGWVAGKLLERATQTLGESASNEAILNGLWSLRDDKVFGLTYPLTFVKETPASKLVCWYPTQVVKGNWVDRSNGTMTCVQK